MKLKLILILSIALYSCRGNQEDKSTDLLFAKSDSMTAKIQESGDRLDSITNVAVLETTDKIKYLTGVREKYSKEIIILQSENKDYGQSLELKNRQIAELKRAVNISDITIRDLKLYLKKLNNRVFEDSLKLITIQNKFEKVKKEYELKKKEYELKNNDPSNDETIGGPDNLLLNFVVDSKRGTIKTPGNLNIYLLPANDIKLVKNFMSYDINCNEYAMMKVKNYKVAKLYKGIYFFKNVPPGKYLIKVCYYYGNYKLVTKVNGQQTVTLEVAPPVQ